jgi:hypothetical protein
VRIIVTLLVVIVIVMLVMNQILHMPRNSMGGALHGQTQVTLNIQRNRVLVKKQLMPRHW